MLELQSITHYLPQEQLDAFAADADAQDPNREVRRDNQHAASLH